MVQRVFFKRPEKEETLAVKREEKIKKLNHINRQIPRLLPLWWVGIGEILGIIFLFLINFYLLFPFFGKEDKTNVFSAPVIPILVKLTSFFLPFLPEPYGIRFWLLIFMLFFPLTFYFLAKEITKRKLTGLLASLISILPLNYFLASRVNLGLLGEDGSHIATLTLIPLACLLLLKFLKNGNFLTGILASLGTTLIALTSIIGLVVFLVFAAFITFSEALLGMGRVKILRFLTVIFLALGFSAFWYSPKFTIFLIYNSPQGVLLRETFFNLLPVSFFLVPILGAFGFLIFENRPNLQPLFLAFFLTVTFFLFSLGTGISHPTPSRFLPALGISLSLLLAILIGEFFDFFLGKKKKIVAFSFLIFAFGFILLTVFLFGQNLRLLEESQVLGIISPDKIVGIWEIKEKTAKTEDIFGYTITGLTTLGVLILRTKLAR